MGVGSNVSVGFGAITVTAAAWPELTSSWIVFEVFAGSAEIQRKPFLYLFCKKGQVSLYSL